MSTTDELRDLVALSGMSQREAAKAIDVDDRIFRSWCAANPEPPMMVIYAMKYVNWVSRETNPLADQ